MKGWYSVDRKIWDNPILNHNQAYSPREAFFYLIGRANFEDRNVPIGVTLHKVRRGELITSQKKLCKQFKWGNTRLRNYLKLLQADDMIKVKAETNLTRITICKYETYQDSQRSNKPEANQKQRIRKAKANTNNNDNNNNNENNVNKEKKLSQQRQFLFNRKHFTEMVEEFALNMEIKSDVAEEFIDYWTEPNKSCTKLKWEMQQTFDIRRRLKRWVRNNFNNTKKEKVRKTFKFSTTMKHVLGYCGNKNCKKFGHSDFYDPWRAERGLEETKCCGTELLNERIQ